MNTYKFEWSRKQGKGNEVFLISTTEERFQLAAELKINRRLTQKELDRIPRVFDFIISDLADSILFLVLDESVNQEGS